MCDHAPAANPRMGGTCVKCGKAMHEPFVPNMPQDNYGPPVHRQDPVSTIDPTRDVGFEVRFLDDAIEMALRLTGIANRAYPLRVNHRLDIGRERYGDGDYLGKDNIKEVLEETPDLAAYAMLELQRLRRVGEAPDQFNEVRLDLVAVAAYGSIADWYAQRAARRLKGLEV